MLQCSFNWHWVLKFLKLAQEIDVDVRVDARVDIRVGVGVGVGIGIDVGVDVGTVVDVEMTQRIYDEDDAAFLNWTRNKSKTEHVRLTTFWCKHDAHYTRTPDLYQLARLAHGYPQG